LVDGEGDVPSKWHARKIGVRGEREFGITIGEKSVIIRPKGRPEKEIAFDDIEWAFQRDVGCPGRAIELFFIGGKTLLLSFDVEAITFLQELNEAMPKASRSVVQLRPATAFIRELKCTDDWVAGKISNFAYLMWLNMVMGRSFNAGALYPVLPRIFCDYQVDDMDTANEAIYRDFTSQTVPKFEWRGSNRDDLVPELFSMGEFLKDESLPGWCGSSPHQFVYVHRKGLESPFISFVLHRWITSVFGIPHRQRNPVECAPILKTLVVVSVSTVGIVYASIRHDDHGRYRLLFCDESGDLVTTRLNFLKLSKITEKIPKRSCLAPQTRFRIPHFADFSSPSTFRANLFIAHGSSLAMVDGHRNYVTLVDPATGTCDELHVHDSDVLCLASEGRWLAAAGRDAVVTLFAPSRPSISIPLYRDEIVCVAVSASFQLVVSGTRDGFLILSSLNRGSTVRVVDLCGCRPYALLITDSWGFIGVCMTRLVSATIEHIVAVFSVNGEMIRSRQIPRAVAAWDSWADSKGFDRIVFATERGRMMSCEAFWLDFADAGDFVARAGVVAIRFAREGGGAVVVCADGRVAFVPLDNT
jgi:hypothetical protein